MCDYGRFLTSCAIELLPAIRTAIAGSLLLCVVRWPPKLKTWHSVPPRHPAIVMGATLLAVHVSQPPV